MARPDFAALALLGALLAAPAGADDAYLGQFPMSAEAGASFSATAPMRLQLSLRPGDPTRFDDLAARVPVERAAGSAILRIAGYPGGHDRGSPEHLKPSFLVDYDEPPIQSLRKAVQNEFGAHPT